MAPRLLRLTIFLGSSLLVAGVVAAALWHLLPYESFRRSTPGDQFLFWEAAVWLLGLCLLFFGAAAGLDSLDLYNTRIPGLEEIGAPLRDPRQRPLAFRPGAWWMVVTGASLLALAAWVRFHVAV